MWWWFDAIISWTKLFLSTVSLSALLYERKPWRPFFLVKYIYQDKNMFSFFFFFLNFYTDYFVLFITTQHIERHFNFTKKKKTTKKIRARCWSLRQSLMGYAFWWCSFLFSTRSSACCAWIPLPFFELFFPSCLWRDTDRVLAVHDRNRNIAQFSFLFFSFFFLI